MYDYFIKEASREAWVQNAIADGILMSDPVLGYVSQHNIVEVGTIAGASGYHVNIRSRIPLEFNSLTTIPAPSTPALVWL